MTWKHIEALESMAEVWMVLYSGDDPGSRREVHDRIRRLAVHG